jgi:sugar (pentulose or hexulose) kinase
LIDGDCKPVASGSYNWQSCLENGFWTYSLESVWAGIKQACSGLLKYEIAGIGVSAMMHGYLVFDKNDNLLVPFRTWRNTTTAQAAEKLTEAFNFNIPQRWSAAHLYQAILNNEPHVSEIAFMTTLAGYVHWKLTGEKVLGVGDASGMFPISDMAYDNAMLCKLQEMTGIELQNILPRIQNAGENAGVLTPEGAMLLGLKAGIPLCPPEGDAGTGMVATNSRTGNVSAGTSIFAMPVLEKPLRNVYTEIDIVTTPTGNPVAMVHCNSCTSDLDAWVKLFGETAELLGAEFDKDRLFEALYLKALDGAPDGGGLLNYNFFSGEPVAGLSDGCPMFLRKPDSRMNLADFMRVQIYSAVAALKLGMEILSDEGVRVDCLSGHGGLFKTADVGQKLMSAALNVPVAVMESAGEGGAWGIALLAAYMQNNAVPLEEFLSQQAFNPQVIHPNPTDVSGFEAFFENYKKGLILQKHIGGLYL